MARRSNLVTAAAQPAAESGRRLAALAPYAILDTLPEPAFDDVAALAAAICGTSASAISFVCVDRQWFKAAVGLDARETPIEHSFCAHALARGTPDLFEVPDATRDPRFAGNPLVTGAPGIRYYAGIPFFGRDGTGLGTLCVIDDKPRAGLDALQHQALRTLASQVTAQLELRRTIAERDAHAQAQQTSARELEWLATHDPLTGLANRTLFQARLQDAVSADGSKNRTALMVLDVDHFKQVNDTLGHDAGDRLLIAVGERLEAATRSTDTVARLGGDEFGILLCGIDTARDIERVTRSIFARLQEPIAYRDRLIEVRLTIGAAIFPDHAVTAADLIQHADVALYAAKAAGRGQAAIFDPAMLVAAQRHGAMMSHARSALASGDIVPFYQPKIDLVTRRVTGFEALLRLRRTDGGVDPAAAIAAAFGDRELATRLGSAMIAQVARDMRDWLDRGLDFGRIALNGSASEFRDDGYADRILAALAAAGVPADRLELEVTESVLLDRDAVAVERALTTLTTAGVRIALDDFGTGYASLSHLNRFPVHVLKIDRSFVSGIEDGAGKRAIVHAILNMAENLGIDTVAEGIETSAQAECLRAAGCRIGQGYLFGHAEPAERVPALIAGIPAAPLCLAA